MQSSGIKIDVLSSNGMHPVMDELVPEFERLSGHTIATTYDTANQILERIRSGETADALIVTAPVIDELTGEGRLTAGSRVDLARSLVGIAVPAGAPKPDIASLDALKRALLDAKSIAYTGTGASGVHFAKVIERLGIAAQVGAKARIPAGGLVGQLLVDGEAEMAVQQISELMAVPGIELVGPLPAQVQLTTQLAAGVFAGSPHARAAKALLSFLTTPAASRVFKAKGLDPVR